jgi:hypothetical protein
MESNIVIERRADRVCRRHQEKRMAVLRRTHDSFRADISPGARSVLNDELLTKARREPLPHEPCDDVRRAAGERADDDVHRPRRVGLRARNARACSKSGGHCCQQEKAPAGKRIRAARCVKTRYGEPS